MAHPLLPQQPVHPLPDRRDAPHAADVPQAGAETRHLVAEHVQLRALVVSHPNSPPLPLRAAPPRPRTRAARTGAPTRAATRARPLDTSPELSTGFCDSGTIGAGHDRASGPMFSPARAMEPGQ